MSWYNLPADSLMPGGADQSGPASILGSDASRGGELPDPGWRGDSGSTGRCTELR
jgi:hypothetical protein